MRPRGRRSIGRSSVRSAVIGPRSVGGTVSRQQRSSLEAPAGGFGISKTANGRRVGTPNCPAGGRSDQVVVLRVTHSSSPVGGTGLREDPVDVALDRVRAQVQL